MRDNIFQDLLIGPGLIPTLTSSVNTSMTTSVIIPILTWSMRVTLPTTIAMVTLNLPTYQ